MMLVNVFTRKVRLISFSNPSYGLEQTAKQAYWKGRGERGHANAMYVARLVGVTVT